MGFYEKFETTRLRVAHRGRRAFYPENTLAAFKAAEKGYAFWEMDLQLSCDDVWIVIHDETLERTTDIEEHTSSGLRPYRVQEYNLQTLRRLDAGSWFLREDPFGTLAANPTMQAPLHRMPPQHLPVLDEIFALAKVSCMPLNLEIKEMPHRSTEEVALLFLEAIQAFEKEIPLLVSSFNHRYLAALHSLHPSLSLAANFERGLPPDLLGYLQRCGAEACHVDLPLAWKLPVEKLKEEKITCGVFTVNDSDTRDLLYDRGVRAIFCDGLTP